MTLTKTIYQNNKKVNLFNSFTPEEAKTELINLLFNKIDKKYKIAISKDHIKNTIQADLYFNHEQANGSTIKYRYNYLFENVEAGIDLY